MVQFVDDCESLEFIIYLIGYPKKGESQILIILDTATSSVLMAGVIDCYSYQAVNKTKDILLYYGIKCLNFFCWTHTDDDHSVDSLEIIDGFCNKATSFYLPEGVYGNEEDFVSYSEEIKTAIDKIKSFNKGQSYDVSSISVPSMSSLHLDKLTRTFKDKKSRETKFQIKALAPIGAIIRRRQDTQLDTKNDSSIALLATFGNYSAFLSGDIENNTIGQINSYHFEALNYLKAPHHTSNTSTHLLKKFDEVFGEHQIDLTCSTVYVQHNLPNKDLVENYKMYAKKFLTTGDISSGNNYGLVRIKYIEKDLNLIEVYLEGNAAELF